MASVNNDGENESKSIDKNSAKLKAVKDEILRDFKEILNKKGRRFLKYDLTDLDIALKLRNALRSLIDPSVTKSDSKLESAGFSPSAASSDPSVDDDNTVPHGRPLNLHQSIVHIKINDDGVEEIVAYEQKSSRDPLKQTPSKRLCRREERQ